jgi:hypothetical protein
MRKSGTYLRKNGPAYAKMTDPRVPKKSSLKRNKDDHSLEKDLWLTEYQASWPPICGE